MNQPFIFRGVWIGLFVSNSQQVKGIDYKPLLGGGTTQTIYRLNTVNIAV